MKKLAILCAAALGAALLVLGTSPSASAYPDLTCNVTVDRQVVHPGQTVTATGVITGADTNRPVTWSFRWNGVTKDRTGAAARASFKAPKVERSRVIRLAADGTASLNGVPRTCVHHLDVKVVAVEVSAPSGGSGLPSTGGPAFWILVTALALLVAGGGTVVASRRRRS